MSSSCPACGTTVLNQDLKEIVLRDHYGGDIKIDIEILRCDMCGFSQEKNDGARREAINKLRTDAVLNIINFFSENKKSIAGIERALGLPQRTITKWKSGSSSPSSSAVALFKLLRVFPWLLDVADNDFCYEEGQKIFLKQASERIIEYIIKERNEAENNTDKLITQTLHM